MTQNQDLRSGSAETSAPFLSIVVPAYNEAQRIGRSLAAIHWYLASKSYSAEVTVVDDGSSDGTADIVASVVQHWPSFRLIRNDRNRGKGYSVRRGVLEARGEYVLFTDADLSAPIDQTGMLIAALESTGADAAIGSRALQRELIGVHQPLFREWGGICFNLAVRLFTGLKLRDTQCGLKLFRREATRRAFEHLKAERFGFDPELLFLVERWGGRIVEIPVRWDNDPATRFSVLRDALRSFREVAEVRWRALTGQYSPRLRDRAAAQETARIQHRSS
ncbi:MAG TPA: dolichyl-phosphate beta-glucosyltransferase [Terriglobia bacterium]|nr:dolichyl-phosphate beta-glucosyltransferase [Terriglobia bacterium]